MQCRGLATSFFKSTDFHVYSPFPDFFQSFADKNKTFWPNLSVRLVEKTEQKLFETFNEQVFSEIVVPDLLWVVLRDQKMYAWAICVDGYVSGQWKLGSDAMSQKITIPKLN